MLPPHPVPPRSTLIAGTLTTWLLAIPLLGLATGMRAMTAIAVICWFAHLGLLPVDHTWAFWAANPISVAVFSLAALGEFVGDKLPKAPNRTAPLGLITRAIVGALVGSIVATGVGGSVVEGALLGLGGAILGTFGGFLARRDIVRNFTCRDWPVALFEDFLTILIAVFAVRLATA